MPRNRSSRRKSTNHSDSGRGFIGLLVVMCILGGLAAVVLSSQGGTNGHRNSSSTSVVNASPANAAANISSAAVTACRANYQAVTAAVSEFEVLNGRPPKAMSDLSSMLKDQPSSAYFTITVDSAHPGQVDVATQGHPAAPGDGNCAYAG